MGGATGKGWKAPPGAAAGEKEWKAPVKVREKGRRISGWAMMKKSLGLIRKDKEILIFPVLMVISSILLLIGLFLLPLINLLASLGVLGLFNSLGIILVLLAVTFFVIKFVTTYLGTAMMGCAYIRLQGGDPSVGDGFRTANGSIGAIAKWTFFSTLVGRILVRIPEVGEPVRFGWSILTGFAFPIMVFEREKSIRNALRRSIELVKKDVSKAALPMYSSGLLFTVIVLLFFPIIFLAVGLLKIGVPDIIVLGFLLSYLMAGICVLMSASTILGVAAYIYATTGKVPEGMSEEDFTGK